MKRSRGLLIASILMVVFIILVSVFYGNYRNTIKIIESEYDSKHTLVEESIYNTIKHADMVGQIIDDALNEQMKGYSLIMLDKYNQDTDILNWDLKELKNQFNGFEIYIINQDLTVVKTTFEVDLGLDFKEFPSFSRLLDNRLQGNSFIADGLDISTNTGELMKYSYMPTPDHKYLLQLSVNINRRFPVMNDVDIFSVANGLQNQYPSVEEVSIFKMNVSGNGILKISKNKPFYSTVRDEQKEILIQKALDSREIQKNTLSSEGSEIKYTEKYIPYINHQQDGKSSWWNSHVIEIKYNGGIMLNYISKERNFFLRSIWAISIVYFVLAFTVLYLIYKLEYMAYYDHLTNLPNRKLFEEYIKQKVLDTKRSKTKLVVLYLDLNNFKKINDQHGHNVGDKLLQEVARGLKNNLRESDIISRLGGDEFTILLSGIQTSDDALRVVQKVSDFFSGPIYVDGHELNIKSSIGVSIYPDDSSKPEILMQKADLAMYQAKNQGLDYMVYTNEIE